MINWIDLSGSSYHESFPRVFHSHSLGLSLTLLAKTLFLDTKTL